APSGWRVGGGRTAREKLRTSRRGAMEACRPPSRGDLGGVSLLLCDAGLLAFARAVGGYHLPTEKVRSSRVVFPWRSLMETVSLPAGKAASGLSRVNSHTPVDAGLNFAPRLSPAAAPLTGKSATTWKDAMSRPVS